MKANVSRNGYLFGSSTPKLSRKRRAKALKINRKALKQKVDSRGSFDFMLILCPVSEMIEMADALIAPKFSKLL